MRHVPAFLALLLLAGCAGAEANWVKPSASEAQTNTDYTTCRRQAQAYVNDVYGKDYDRIEMMGAPPTLTGQANNLAAGMQRDQLADVGRKRAEQETSSCMQGKGYYPR